MGRDPAALLALIAALLAGAGLWQYLRPAKGYDFYQFWVVTQGVSRGGLESVYRDADRAALGVAFLEEAVRDRPARRRRAAARKRRFIDTWSTPLLYTAFAPLASGDYERDLTRYQLLCLAGSAFALGIFYRALRYPAAAALLLTALLLQWFEPLRSDLRVGNVNQLQLAGLAAALWLRGRAPPFAGPALGGAALGLLVAFKPNVLGAVAMLAVLRAVRREWRALGADAVAFGAGLALAALASTLYMGSLASWGDWLRYVAAAVSDDRTAGLALHRGNFALDRIAFELWGLHPGAALGLALAAAALVCAARRGRGQPARAAGAEAVEDLAAAALGLTIGLLAAPLCFVHYYWLLVPLLLVMLRPASGPRLPLRRWAVAVLALLALGDPAALSGLAGGAAIPGVARAALAAAAALALTLAGLAELARLRAGAPAD